jgi:hypothetical protein
MSSWRMAGSSSRVVVGWAGSFFPAFLSFVGFFFFGVSCLSARDAPIVAERDANSFIHVRLPTSHDTISSASYSSSSIINHQLIVPPSVSLASSLFLHNMAIYLGQLVRLHPFSVSDALAPYALSVSSCRFSFLSRFLLLRAAVLVHIIGGIGVGVFVCFFTYVRWHWSPVPTPPAPLCFLFLLRSRVFVARIATCNFKS